MAALNAHVKNGRLVLDEPTTLPEGAEVQLWVVEGDDLDDEDRAALHDAIREGIEDANAGRTIDADEWAAGHASSEATALRRAEIDAERR